MKAETVFLVFSRSVYSQAIPDFSSEHRPYNFVDKAEPDRMSTSTVYKTSGILREQTIAVLLLVSAILLVTPTPGWGQETKPAPTATAGNATSTSDAQLNDGKPAAEDLLAKSIEHTWRQFSSKENVALGDVWKIVEVENEKYLKCVGEPKGFLYTKKKFSDFELTLEWKYTSDPNGNSGVLVYTQDEMRLWPVSMQVQLHQPKAGSVFPSDGAKGTSSDVASLAHEVGKWNTCRIVSQSGRLSVQINGKNAAEVAGCDPAKGYIAIQCEGSETLFRRLRVRDLSARTETIIKDSPAPKPGKTEESATENSSADSVKPAQTGDQTSG
ncbi:MAG TPA: DUF1080 domain-containing protein [Fuerstia sp.]|nr:DUF1080 domain-containing protein [Fuerstiella sp.]